MNIEVGMLSPELEVALTDDVSSVDVDYVQRLTLLRDYLIQLDESLWDFNYFTKTATECGTIGCSLGHCPEVFPGFWTRKKSHLSQNTWRLTTSRGLSNIRDILRYACEFFDITYPTAVEVFLDGPDGLTKEDMVERINGLIQSKS